MVGLALCGRSFSPLLPSPSVNGVAWGDHPGAWTLPCPSGAPAYNPAKGQTPYGSSGKPGSPQELWSTAAVIQPSAWQLHISWQPRKVPFITTRRRKPFLWPVTIMLESGGHWPISPHATTIMSPFGPSSLPGSRQSPKAACKRPADCVKRKLCNYCVPP